MAACLSQLLANWDLMKILLTGMLACSSLVLNLMSTVMVKTSLQSDLKNL